MITDGQWFKKFKVLSHITGELLPVDGLSAINVYNNPVKYQILPCSGVSDSMNQFLYLGDVVIESHQYEKQNGDLSDFVDITVGVIDFRNGCWVLDLKSRGVYNLRDRLPSTSISPNTGTAFHRYWHVIGNVVEDDQLESQVGVTNVNVEEYINE